jgi:ATP-dependent Clp protease ATP-binding subunit ClpX
VKGSSIGFSGQPKSSTEDSSLHLVTPEDIIKFGMIPEFVGRFPSWVALEELNREDLIEILINIKHSYIEQYQWLFRQDNVELEFTRDALETIADNTMRNKTGARGLHSELERVLMPHMYRIAEYARAGITRVEIDSSMVETPAELKQVNE